MFNEIFIGANCGVGKTKSAIALCVDYLIKDGYKVIFINDEMTFKSITDRFTSHVSLDLLDGVNFWDTKSPIDIREFINERYVVCVDIVSTLPNNNINKHDYDLLLSNAHRVIRTKHLKRDGSL